MTARTCVRCWPRSRAGDSSASTATRTAFTAGFACAKVNRDAELVHSPERLTTPLRRVGAKGEGKFAPITWDEALDEITERWQAIIAESGAEALLGYAYSAHQGLMNRGLPRGLFRALGATRLIAGTVCDTCCERRGI